MNFSLDRLRLRVACILFALSFGVAFSHAQIIVAQNNTVLADAILPNAPLPMHSATSVAIPDAAPTGVSADSNVQQFFLATSGSRYSTVLNPGEKRVPFTVGEKFIYSARESVDTEEFLTVMVSSGFNHLIDGNPHYGSDGNGFGERVGTAALREASIHLLGDGVFASALHQDPRYFRLGRDQPLKQRAKHVIASAVTSHSDRDGHVQPDYSGITARAATAAMTLTYYPHVSATGTVAAETFGYSLLGDMAGNALLEFLPDLLRPIKNAVK